MNRPVYKFYTEFLVCNEALVLLKGLRPIKKKLRAMMPPELERTGRVLIKPVEYHVNEHVYFDRDATVVSMIARCIYVGRRRCKSTKIKHQMMNLRHSIPPSKYIIPKGG